MGGLFTESFGSATRPSSRRSPCVRTPGEPACASYGRDPAERTAARLAEALTEIARFEMPRPAGS
jgi:hypothetical protein